MKFYQPLFFSRKKGDEVVLMTDLAIIGAITLFLPPSVAYLILTLVGDTDDFLSSMNTLGSIAGPIAFLFVASPIFSIIALPVGIMMGLFALRRGIAGLGFAIFAAALPFLAIAFLALIIPPASEFPLIMLAMAPFSMTYGAVMWFALRWRRPSALIERTSPLT